MNNAELLEFLGTLPPYKEPSITLAGMFRKEGNENFSSAWLAFLLTPKLFGNSEPLEAFLDLVGIASKGLDLSEIEIKCERVFNDRRRIDIFLENDEFIIGIENKIWADEGVNQTYDYYNSIKKLADGKKPWKLVFLTPDIYKEPSNGVHFKYSHLYEAFSQIRIDFTTNLRGAFVLQDYLTYIKEYIMGNGYLDQLLTVGKNSESFTLANKYLNSAETEFQRHINYALDRVKGELGAEWEIPSAKSKFQIYKNSWYNENYDKCNTKDKYFLHYEIWRDSNSFFQVLN